MDDERNDELENISGDTDIGNIEDQSYLVET